MHNYISSIGTKLHEAIGNHDADLIRSYRRALNSGIARAQKVAATPEKPTPEAGPLHSRWHDAGGGGTQG
jgi:hypothetical protein